MIKNKQGVVLSPSTNYKGYKIIRLSNNGNRPCKAIHRLVAETFIPNPDNLPQVNHKDGNKENNSFTNLEWVTNEENSIHAQRMRKGEIT